MKTFKTVSMVRARHARVWEAMRDELPLIASGIENIAGVEQRSRRALRGGCVEIENTWRAAVSLPSALTGLLSGEHFAWLDRATWNDSDGVCSWTIEPVDFSQCLRCSGTTRYSPALGGRGTRIDFSGELEFNAAGLRGVPSVLTRVVGKTCEAFLLALIPTNFQKLARALGSYVEAAPSAGAPAASAGREGPGLMR